MFKKVTMAVACVVITAMQAQAFEKPKGIGYVVGNWDDNLPQNGWSFVLTDTTARSGKLSQRFELRNGDCTVQPQPRHDPNWGCYNDRERAEVMGHSWRPGKDKWIGFSVKLTDEWKETLSWTNHCTSIFQIKQTEDVYQGNLGMEYVGSHAVVHGVICGSTFGLRIMRTGYNDNKFDGWMKTEDVWLGNINSIKDKWNDVALRWNTKNYRKNESSLEIYLNGNKVGKWKNITSKFFPREYTFKYGPYRGGMKKQGVKSVTQVIYFDEIRYGRSFESVDPKGKKAID